MNKYIYILWFLSIALLLSSCGGWTLSWDEFKSTPDANLVGNQEWTTSGVSTQEIKDWNTETQSQDDSNIASTNNTVETKQQVEIPAEENKNTSYTPSTTDSRSVLTMNMEAESQAELKARLTPLQYEVTQNGGTEQAFSNPYDKNYADGIYVDIVDGTPVFSSTTKFDSKTGWPSFAKPIEANNIKTQSDTTLFITRTEVLWAKSGSHIGHLFNDGPESMGGLRYCLNSAALAFIPKDQMQERGYGEYLSLFD